MSFRFKAALAACALAMVSGCVSPPRYDGTGRSSPEVKFENGPRLAKEVGWLYADLQDVIFGVDYHQDIEDLYGRCPYE